MTTMLTIFVIWGVVAILGGIVAAWKGDFFSRGFFMTLVVGPLCLLFLLLAPKSEARKPGSKDFSCWQQHGGAALIVQMALYTIGIIAYTVFA